MLPYAEMVSRSAQVERRETPRYDTHCSSSDRLAPTQTSVKPGYWEASPPANQYVEGLPVVLARVGQGYFHPTITYQHITSSIIIISSSWSWKLDLR